MLHTTAWMHVGDTILSKINDAQTVRDTMLLFDYLSS